MSDFFRFPHTPHLVWLAQGSPRDDKILLPDEAKSLLSQNVVAEEKLDGANLGISVDKGIQVQNRGQFLIPPFGGQFSRLPSWLAHHEEAFIKHLPKHLILFGEWCAAKHSLDYDKLPDWFLGFDVYDRTTGKFWSTKRRNELLEQLELAAVPKVFQGHSDLQELKNMVLQYPSAYRPNSLEGVVIRKENDDWLESRAKLVHPEFTQAIGEHWRRAALHWNQVKTNH